MDRKTTVYCKTLEYSTLFNEKKISNSTKSIKTKYDDITFSKRTCTLMALVKINLQIYSRLENKWQNKKAMLSAFGVAQKNITRPRGPLQFSCSRNRNAFLKFM